MEDNTNSKEFEVKRPLGAENDDVLPHTDDATDDRSSEHQQTLQIPMKAAVKNKHKDMGSFDAVVSLATNYGDVPLKDLKSNRISGRVWTAVSSLAGELKDDTVLIRGRLQAIRAMGQKRAFLIARECGHTVQCVLDVNFEDDSGQMVKYARTISKESFVDIQGIVTVPPHPIKGASQQVEVQVKKIYCLNRAAKLPISVEDCARSDSEIDKALEAGKQMVRVNQDTRLNNRIIELRTPANYGIFCLESHMLTLFRQLLLNEDFMEIRTPSINAGTSEGGSAVFGLKYKNNRPACLTPMKYLPNTLRLTFEEGIQMLKDAGFEADPFGDLNTELERALGKLFLEKFETEFYILHHFPLAVRPFFTMPCADNEVYSNSFNVYMRGEEIISGAQRVHLPDLLESRARQCGIDVSTISTYIDSFRYGVPLHGGFGAGLERVVMLFCGLSTT